MNARSTGPCIGRRSSAVLLPQGGDDADATDGNPSHAAHGIMGAVLRTLRCGLTMRTESMPSRSRPCPLFASVQSAGVECRMFIPMALPVLLHGAAWRGRCPFLERRASCATFCLPCRFCWAGACHTGPGNGGYWHPDAGSQHRHQPAHLPDLSACRATRSTTRRKPRANYFFYDGLYWVYQGDDWYASGWYNGPWRRVLPEYVPLYVLRVPVRYYRQPPRYFRVLARDAPPRWGEHWGRDWERRRPGWDRWDRDAAPAPAPLPTYQRRYPQNATRSTERQPSIRPRTTATSRANRWSASISRSRNVPRPRLRVVPLRARPIAGRTRRATTRRATTRRAATAPIVTAAVESTLNPATDGLPGSRVWRGPGGRP